MGNKFLDAVSNMPRPNPRKKSGFIENPYPSDDTRIKEVRLIGVPMSSNHHRKGELLELSQATLSEASSYIQA